VHLVWLVELFRDPVIAGEAKMRAPIRSLAAVATLLVAGSMVPNADAADPASPAPPQCLYRDAKYGLGATICVAPQFGQQCNKDSAWTDPTNKDPFDKVCASAKISVPGIPPAQCIYHDVKYAPGAIICVAPKVRQMCNIDGGWTTPSGDDNCKNAQTPAPTYPAAPASK
jgi:hypothetical protein